MPTISRASSERAQCLNCLHYQKRPACLQCSKCLKWPGPPDAQQPFKCPEYLGFLYGPRLGTPTVKIHNATLSIAVSFQDKAKGALSDGYETRTPDKRNQRFLRCVWLQCGRKPHSCECMPLRSGACCTASRHSAELSLPRNLRAEATRSRLAAYGHRSRQHPTAVGVEHAP